LCVKTVCNGASVIPTVKSETNKESEITEWLSPLFPTSTAIPVQYIYIYIYIYKHMLYTSYLVVVLVSRDRD
jgi:hypothetical protein